MHCFQLELVTGWEGCYQAWEIEALKAELDATADRIVETVESFKADRASRFVSDVTDRNKLYDQGLINSHLLKFT